MAGILALFGVVILVGVFFAMLSRINDLVRRVDQLQAELDRTAKKLDDRPAAKPAAPPPARARKPKPEPPAPRSIAKSVEGPWSAVKTTTPAPPPSAPSRPTPPPEARPEPRAFVFRRDRFKEFTNWIQANWFLAIGAVSLALSGVFLVQYGIEHGVITPFWRVIGAACLGIALIWFGEFIRRRGGDFGSTAYLPSTFSGAGLVALFSAVLAAEHLYGLIGAGGALAWLVFVAAVAVVLGWNYGPFLSVVGILGSIAAPFLVGGESDTPELFYYYFALIAAAGLAVDALKRWAWVSAFALIFAFDAAWMFYAGGAGDRHFLAFALISTVLAVAIPPLSLTPRHDGATVLGAFIALSQTVRVPVKWPAFPTRIASATFAAACGFVTLVALKDAGPAEAWLSVVSLALLFVAATVWFRTAPALDDLALIPPVLFVGIVVDQAWSGGSLFRLFNDPAHLLPEAARPGQVSVLAAMGLAGSALAHWRGLFPSPRAILWSAGAFLFAPVTLVVLELFWSPSPILGAGWWAGHAMIVAAAMVLFASQTARRDGDDRRRTALYALAAMTMISMALMLVLSSTALTLALGAMVLGAALLDARLDLRPVTLLTYAGAAVIAWRLIIDPGLDWAEGAPLWEVLLAYLGSAGLFAAAARVLTQGYRPGPSITAESTAWLALALLATVLLDRWLGPAAPTHSTVSLHGLVWIVSALNQLYRMRAGDRLQWVRIVLAILFGFLGVGLLLLALVVLNPLFQYDPVAGPLILDSLAVAYLLPALPLAFAAWKFTHLPALLRLGFGIGASLSASLYSGLEIRRFWHGRDLSAPTVLDGELYSYTVALLVVSIALLFVAFWRRSHVLRKIALAGVALTIAKVFLIDMSGLAGLYRVASFLGLGLSLAGLAWLSRQMAAQWNRPQSK